MLHDINGSPKINPIKILLFYIQSMASYFQLSGYFHRLTDKYEDVQNNPDPYINVQVRNFSEILRINLLFKPDPEDMFQCHYCIRGPKDSVYEGGYYFGKLVLPREYPFKPPSIYWRPFCTGKIYLVSL